jgi:predicted transcriptional regulator
MSTDVKDTISFRLSRKKRLSLDALASSMDRSRSELIDDAIKAYLDVQKWQIEEIGRAVKEAEAGNFASEAEVKATFAKLTS